MTSQTHRPYDPFSAGPSRVETQSFELEDHARGRRFPVDVWSPEGAAGAPLVIYSHHSGGHRRVASFLCTHLASHGYTVAAMDHSEVAARDQLPDERAARIQAIIDGRVPDIRLLMDHFGRDEVGLAGHSFGGWAVMATPEVDARVASLVSMAAGGDHLKPGILPLTIDFKWLHPVPALYLAAENDVPIPLDGVLETYARAPEPKRLFILRKADHNHFVDDVEGTHERVRQAQFPPEAAWIPASMVPVATLTSGAAAHIFVRGLTLAHFDATLRGLVPAARFLAGDVQAELAARGVDAMPPSPARSSRQ